MSNPSSDPAARLDPQVVRDIRRILQWLAVGYTVDGVRRGLALADGPMTLRAALRTNHAMQHLVEAQEQLVEAQQRLVEAQAATEKREQEMLVWTRVAGVAAVLALVVSAVAIVVTLAVA